MEGVKKLIIIYTHGMLDSGNCPRNAYYLIHVFTRDEIIQYSELKNLAIDFYPYKQKKWTKNEDIFGPFHELEELQGYLKKLGKALNADDIYLLSVNDYNQFLTKGRKSSDFIDHLADIGRPLYKDNTSSKKRGILGAFLGN